MMSEYSIAVKYDWEWQTIGRARGVSQEMAIEHAKEQAQKIGMRFPPGTLWKAERVAQRS